MLKTQCPPPTGATPRYISDKKVGASILLKKHFGPVIQHEGQVWLEKQLPQFISMLPYQPRQARHSYPRRNGALFCDRFIKWFVLWLFLIFKDDSYYTPDTRSRRWIQTLEIKEPDRVTSSLQGARRVSKCENVAVFLILGDGIRGIQRACLN